MKKILFIMFVMIGVLAFAQTQQNLTINAQINQRLTLTFSQSAINFTDTGDPDSNPTLAADINTASGLDVEARIRGYGNADIYLRITTAPNLSDGTNTIGINNVSWTLNTNSGGFVIGNMGPNALVGQWNTPGVKTANMNFFLANSWDYVAGNYTSTVTYTLQTT